MAKRARRIAGDSKLRRKLRRWPETLRLEITKELVEGAIELRDEMERLAPKDDGTMAEQALVKVSRDGLSARIGYGKRPGFKAAWKRGGFKALWQEFGTEHHKAQPFIRPAYRAKLRAILGRIDRAVNRAINRASRGNF